MQAKAARALRTLAEGEAGSGSRACLSREGDVPGLLRRRRTRRQPPRPSAHERVQRHRSQPLRHRGHRLSRGHSRTSSADLHRAGDRRACRHSASSRGTPHSSKAGRSTPSGSAKKLGSIRILTPTTDGCRPTCGARSGSSSTPAFTRSTGPATRWCSTSTTIRRSKSRPCRPRWIATSAGRAGPRLQDRPAQDPGAARPGQEGSGRQVRPARVPRRGARFRRSAAGCVERPRGCLDRATEEPCSTLACAQAPVRRDYGPRVCLKMKSLLPLIDKDNHDGNRR